MINGLTKDIDNLIFQCGDGARNSLDFSAATYKRNSDKPRLIDSFKFNKAHLKILVMSYCYLEAAL
jgi:hypothetical protein